MNGFYVTAVVIQFLDKSRAFHNGTLKQKVNARGLKFQSFSLICRCFLIATGDSRPGLLINKSVRPKKKRDGRSKAG